MTKFEVTDIPTPPLDVVVQSVSYRPPKKGEWFLSRYSDDWVQAENNNKKQRHLTITEKRTNQ
jgi:hypothetical protein